MFLNMQVRHLCQALPLLLPLASAWHHLPWTWGHSRFVPMSTSRPREESGLFLLPVTSPHATSPVTHSGPSTMTFQEVSWACQDASLPACQVGSRLCSPSLEALGWALLLFLPIGVASQPPSSPPGHSLLGRAYFCSQLDSCRAS